MMKPIQIVTLLISIIFILLWIVITSNILPIDESLSTKLYSAIFLLSIGALMVVGFWGGEQQKKGDKELSRLRVQLNKMTSLAQNWATLTSIFDKNKAADTKSDLRTLELFFAKHKELKPHKEACRVARTSYSESAKAEQCYNTLLTMRREVVIPFMQGLQMQMPPYDDKLMRENINNLIRVAFILCDFASTSTKSVDISQSQYLNEEVVTKERSMEEALQLAAQADLIPDNTPRWLRVLMMSLDAVGINKENMIISGYKL